eukprot:m.83474 g.83474  ORF g.83474 m.83474 type:complete len:337 (-) comp12923_c0_seq1:386-1396(-)
MMLLLLSTLLFACTSYGYCSDIPKCNMNGVYETSSGTCDCDAAWEGTECEKLAVLPVPKENGYKQEHVSSWGGNAIYINETGLYHGFFSEFVHNCGVNTWGKNSRIVHATSKTALGPYVFADEALPPQAHNAHIARANGTSGKFLLWHIHVPDPTCIGPSYNCSVICHNGSTPHNVTIIDKQDLQSINWTKHSGQLHSSDSVVGPWGGEDVKQGYGGCNNPSPWFNPDGSSIMVCEGPGHYQPGVEFASNYLGPFNYPRYNVTCPNINQTSAGFHSEDPVVWRDVFSLFCTIFPYYCLGSLDTWWLSHVISCNGPVVLNERGSCVFSRWQGMVLYR